MAGSSAAWHRALCTARTSSCARVLLSSASSAAGSVPPAARFCASASKQRRSVASNWQACAACTAASRCGMLKCRGRCASSARDETDAARVGAADGQQNGRTAVARAGRRLINSVQRCFRAWEGHGLGTHAGCHPQRPSPPLRACLAGSHRAWPGREQHPTCEPAVQRVAGGPPATGGRSCRRRPRCRTACGAGRSRLPGCCPQRQSTSRCPARGGGGAQKPGRQGNEWGVEKHVS